MNGLKISPKIQRQVLTLLQKLNRFRVMLFILTYVLIYAVMVFKIGALLDNEPSDDMVSERLQSVVRPKIDQSSVDKMLRLEQQNVDVKSLFQQARDNPFSE